jgi:UDP-N-acetylmuramyl pentapeptide phosphotransferase/UDP-N-acetylglucosamine-1-phosphate transferase
MNTLFLGYYLMIGIILLLLTKELQIINSIMPLNIMVSILFIIFIFNFFGKLFSGDSGAYSISFVLGFFMINLVNLSEKISPYFIACLLWYPAYECLFSILRKSVKNKFLTKADNKHLHHLIFSFFKEKTKFKSENINLLTGLSINLFNLIIFFNAYNNVSQTKNLIFLIFISSSLYTFLYFYLSKNLSD